MVDLFSIEKVGGFFAILHNKKVLEAVAGDIHNQAEEVNEVLKEGSYHVESFIDCFPELNRYELTIKVKFNKDEHKDNTHGQKIHI